MLVNGRYLARSPTGVDRFAIELVAALSRKHGPRAVRIAVPPGTTLLDPATAEQATIEAVGAHGGHRWEQTELARAAGADPLINLCNTAPLMRREQLVVIHDLGTVANASNYSAAFRLWYRVMHGQIMRRSKVVATVSKFSADELGRHYGKRQRGLEVIYEGGEHILRTPSDAGIIERLDLEGRRFVLAVGSKSPNKNFAGVLKAVELLGDPDLLVVAAGGANSRIFNDADGNPVESKALRLAGYVSDGELRALYEHATCFAFPSFYEGFGLPPLEAMCCGCPVIVSDRASLPEVCGDAALYCKAEDPATIAAALKRLLASDSLQKELSEKGRARAAIFGWDRAAQQFDQIIDANFA